MAWWHYIRITACQISSSEFLKRCFERKNVKNVVLSTSMRVSALSAQCIFPVLHLATFPSGHLTLNVQCALLGRWRSLSYIVSWLPVIPGPHLFLFSGPGPQFPRQSSGQDESRWWGLTPHGRDGKHSLKYQSGLQTSRWLLRCDHHHQAQGWYIFQIRF